MWEEQRDREEVLMSIRKATMFADPIFKVCTIGMIKIMQFMARMVKENLIDKRAFKDFQSFARRTEGNFDIINVPIETKGEYKLRFGSNADIVDEFAGLREKGVRFYEIPDLNKGDNYIQIAVAREDKELFSAWFERYLKNKMRGGEKNLDTLEAFSNGEYTILELPFEKKEEIFREDFEKMNINYSVLPDMKVGDGLIQLAVADIDVNRVQKWYKLYQKEQLTGGKKKLEDLKEVTNGEYTIMKLPFKGEEKTFQKDFKKLKVNYSVLPNIDVGEGVIQLAVANDDVEKIEDWYNMYQKDKLNGGEKDLESLNTLTDGRTSLFSIPLEGREEIFRADFQALKINYGILPDLKVGDGEIQIVVATSDVPQLEYWFKLYQQDMLKKGKQVPDITPIDMETYQKTAEMSVDDYINTGDEEIKEMKEKYESNEEKAQKVELAQEHKSYEDYENDRMYQKFTINRETLVDNLTENKDIEEFFEKWSEKGYFVSRIPGTWGENIEYLLVDKEQVFETHDRKTYTAFIKKDSQPIVINSNKMIKRTEERMFANQLYDTYYALSKQEKDKTDKIRNKYDQKKKNGRKKSNKQEKIPTPPIKK